MRSTWKTRSRNELFVLGVGLCVLFLAATIWEVQAACDPRNNCASCSADGRCITCRAGFGYQSLTGHCETCGMDCVECSPIGGNCTKCIVGYGPDFKPGDGSCGPCIQDNCDAGCDEHGAGTCDSCNDGYGPIPATTNCSKCIEHCVSCPVKTSECESCEFGFAVFDPGNRSCGVCSDHCTINGCFRRGPGACDKCDPGYEFFKNNFSCGACAANCTSCPVNGASKCDNCTFGYGLTPTNTCALCSTHCKEHGCNITGAGKCDMCDFGYGLLLNGSCDMQATTGYSGRPSSGTIRTVVYGWTTAMTTWTTFIPDQITSALGGDVVCPMLEVGLGLGVPCGFIIIVLLIIIIVFCVQNRSLREYKKESQDNRQIQAMDSTISNAPPQPTSTQYQQLKMQGTEREYERIEDRYDTISTADTEIRVISDKVNHFSRRATLLPSEEDRYDTVSTADTEITGQYETTIN